MKTKFLLTTLALSALSVSVYGEGDPVLMRINGQEIKKSEFEYIYHKNTQQQVAEQKNLDEYLNLFVNFKLKVAEAESRGIDTTKAFMTELAGYRKQLAQPYLVDKTVDEALAREAYDRMKENVEVSHILLRLDPNASEAQVKQVYNKITAYKQKLEKGYDFGKLAKEVSEDPSAQQNNGYLGYISGFMTVYPFETAAYNTPVGQISEPVRTQFGYHLLRVTDRRQDPGEVLASHIMKMTPRNADEKALAEAKKAIDKIYAQLQKGADFSELAKNESDDTNSGTNGGELPWFGAGRMVPEFEKEVFALTDKGSITKPFRSPYGWHIAKLLDRRGIDSYDAKKSDILRRIARDERGSKGHDALIAKLKDAYRFSMQPEGEKALNQLALDYSPVDSVFCERAAGLAAPMMSLAGKTYTTADFAAYLRTHKGSNQFSHQDILAEKKKAFIDATIIAYEDSQLENKYADFRNLMREYRDGILLFEVSNKEVWEKASQDVAGLQRYFKKNKKSYRWDAPKFKGFVVECKNESVAEQARKIIKKAPADSVAIVLRRELNNDSIQFVRVQKGLYAKGDNPVVDALRFKEGDLPENHHFPVSFFSGKKLKRGPESYEDVRGLVTADYQTYLEKIWIQELKKKNAVEINEDVLKTVKPL
ncbi:MAG: peptidylprolyl isomerase [Bacteroidales bacterium]